MTPFPAAAGLTFAEVGGGLSGARVWRGEDAAGVPRVVVKRHPAGYPAERLRQIHVWMRAARLAAVPAVFESADGDTVADAAGHATECLFWVPGEALASSDATAACELLAALHRCWLPLASPPAPPPAVTRRRAVLADAAPVLADPPPHLRHTADAVRPHLPAALAALAAIDRPGPVHPCLCDPRPDHFRFTGDALTGVIDFAAMKPDHPAVDLARLLMETGHLAEGVAAYRGAGGHPAVTVELVQALADTGRVGSMANWLIRLHHREPSAAEAERLERLRAGLVD